MLVDLHDSPRNSSLVCTGQVNMEAVQQVLAAKWAVDVINNQSLPHELKIGETHREKRIIFREPQISGLQIHDTCSSREMQQAQLFQLISTVQGRQPSRKPRLIGQFD